MNVISKAGLFRLCKSHPATLPTLSLWFIAARRGEWRGLQEVRRDFPTVDQVGNVLIFNVMGGNYRLICRVSYAAQRLYVKALLNHREYDRKEWMKWV